MIRNLTLVMIGVLATSAWSKDEDKLKDLDEILFDGGLWAKTMDEIKGPEEEDEEDEVSEALRRQLREKGFHLGKSKSDGLEWLSSRKEGLRAGPGCFQLADLPVGEVVIRGKDGKPVDLVVSLYNRGDDGVIPLVTFQSDFNDWKETLDEQLEVKSERRDSKGAVPIKGWMWRKGDTAFLLESSVNKSEKRAEFIRLRAASISGAKNRSTRVAKRSSLEENVVKDDDGFTFVDGVPMVDQGQKGYCVVASIERVARYYGLEMDQHEMAQLANTTDGGTNGDEMEDAFQKITGKIHVRTLKLIDYDDRQFEKDVREYNRAAKKAGVPTFDYDPDEWIVSPTMFWARAHPETFRDMKAKQNRCDHFMRKIKEYVDQGIPLCWTLYLGMFKEDDLPQSYGGHMRLITGYHFAEGEVPKICYTDSWGEGHGKKVMRADEAFGMTMALYAMVPNQ